MFSNTSNIRFLSLGHNALNTLPEGLLDGLDSLAELHLYAMDYDCSCANLWMYGHADTTKMKIYGDIICRTPSAWESTSYLVCFYW